MLGATAAFIIDRRFDRAAIYALGAAVLAYFGVINGTALGLRQFVAGRARLSADRADLPRLCVAGANVPIEVPEDADRRTRRLTR